MAVQGRLLRRWYLERRRWIRDLVALAIACVLSSVLILSSGLAERYLGFAHAHPAWRLEELTVCLAVSSLFLALFSWRRWQDASGLLADAGTDALTGLGNRRKTLRILELEFASALQRGTALSLVMFDVDHFKRVNDTYGHPVGDQVLATIARRIKRKMRASDHLGRWGGEEFLMICPETDLEGVIRIAERMRRTVKRRPMSRAGIVTASFGVATYAGEGEFEALVKQADHYLYLAKQNGRDRVVSRLGAATAAVTQPEGFALSPGPESHLEHSREPESDDAVVRRQGARRLR